MVAAGAAAAAPRPNPSPSPHRRRAASALSPSKSTNANRANADSRGTKPKAKPVSSRYLLAPSSKSTSTSTSTSTTTTSSSNSTSTSGSTPSRRFASPLPRRSSSVDRPRPASNAAPGEAAGANGATTTTTRSLSVAFQGRSYFLETSKAKPATSPSPVRRPAVAAAASTTPERRRPAAGTVPERAKGSEGGHAHQRWPMSAHGFEGNPLAKSLDCSLDKKGAAVLAAVRSLRQSMAFDDGVRRTSFDSGDYLMSSDTESLSSGSNSGSQDAGNGISHRSRPPPKGMSVPARFLHDAAGSRLHRFADPPGTPYVTHNSGLASSPRTAPVKKSLLNGFVSSPLNRPVRQSSPSKLVGNSSRRMSSPSRPRNSTCGGASTGDQHGRSSSGYGIDGQARRRWLGGSKVDGEHLLRILSNRHLQWRCVNAQADAALASQKMAAEKDLCDAWITLGMRKSVALKRFQLQLFRNNWKLMTVLKGQMPYLEEWSSLEMDYADSLSGIVEALTATILCLPVDGAKADIQDVKNAVGSSVDIMQTIGSSICTLLAKLSGTSILVSDLARIAAQERALMDQSRELLSTLASLHVKYCSLQGQRVQTAHRRLNHS
uniref:Uncharacterized protein n=1 Tax=Avena sativa TaxID=4498 RepID=A0ACD6A833_AVESA